MAPSKQVANKTASHDALKAKRAWDVASAPLKSLPMQAFMLYMSGGGVQIFSIGIVFVLLLSPFRNLAGINEGFFFRLCYTHLASCSHVPFQAFAQYAPSSSRDPKSITSLPLHKLVYILCNLLTLAVGLWKCRSMGLLPIGTGDWLAFEARNLVSLRSVFPSPSSSILS